MKVRQKRLGRWLLRRESMSVSGRCGLKPFGESVAVLYCGKKLPPLVADGSFQNFSELA